VHGAFTQRSCQLRITLPGTLENSSATIEGSTDGLQWTRVVDTGSILSYAMSYFTVNRVAARYVRVTADAGVLNELELHSTTDSFENDAVGYVPRGYTGAIGATVTDENTAGDGHAVGTAPPTNSGVTALTGHTFATSGTVPTYDNFVIDDVEQS
jgi:hypothetical protein